MDGIGWGFEAAHGLSYAKIERIATLLRDQMEVPHTKALNGVEMFESLDECTCKLDGETIQMDYDVCPLPLGVEAMTYFDQAARKIVIVLSPETYALLEADNPRARFSLFHEISHAILHPRELQRLSQLPHQAVSLNRGEAEHPIYRDTEWQAHALTAALLMPAAGLVDLEEKDTLTTDTIQARFNVSKQAARKRLDVYRKRKHELINS